MYPTVSDVHALGGQQTGLDLLIAGNQPAGRGDNTPPMMATVVTEEPTNGPVGARMAGFRGPLSVGHHRTGLESVQHSGHIGLKRGHGFWPTGRCQFRWLPRP